MHSEIIGRDSIHRAELTRWFTIIHEYLRNIEEYFKHSRDKNQNFRGGVEFAIPGLETQIYMNSTCSTYILYLYPGGSGFEYS
jgi:hypothetical protein